MVAVPAATAVTTPVDASTVATVGSEDVQVPPAVPEVEKVDVPAMQSV